MIQAGERLLLVSNKREYYVRAGEGTLSTDLGILDLEALVGAAYGSIAATHLGHEFTVRRPKATDFFNHASRTGAPMLPKDIGMVIAYTGMNKNDVVLDAGTGSGIAAIYFGGIARSVVTCEIRPEFATRAEKNIRDAGLENVEVRACDVLDVEGEECFDIVHLDLPVTYDHVARARALLVPGGYLACYTPFIEGMNAAYDAAATLFSEVHTYECMEREMTRGKRGTRPSTRVGHSGYITIARR
ncbi:methyltransferase domain-containing protein [Methanofollis aquaemaris]|uniref:Methyltransferase domain-containing protein n=1 Tax=Methanofollis aquaemaris TaxID=126734 RepID=A0A8A3S814_9EURY|nr:methyltransferase domain-containing protein [Methanofollis aquaemaris]QSZ67830.1 methyltransferase domain-containing protein [Methanofollis aquaemaris]